MVKLAMLPRTIPAGEIAATLGGIIGSSALKGRAGENPSARHVRRSRFLVLT
jgi:hypothetical protein